MSKKSRAQTAPTKDTHKKDNPCGVSREQIAVDGKKVEVRPRDGFS